MNNDQNSTKQVTISCQNLEKFIVDFLDGQLTPELDKAFTDHIKECEICEIYLEEYKQTIDIGKTAFSNRANEDISAMPEKLVDAILSAHKNSS